MAEGKILDSVINLLNLTSVIRRTRVRKAQKRSAVSGGQSCSVNLKMEMTWPAAVSPRLRPGLHDFFLPDILQWILSRVQSVLQLSLQMEFCAWQAFP